jgi:hypothetical protein
VTEERVRYLVAYTAAYGSEARWNAMALDIYRALKEATGVAPATLMGSGSRDAGLFQISGPADAQIVYGAIVKRLSVGLWDWHATDPDRLLVVEIAKNNAVASDAVVQTVAGMR